MHNGKALKARTYAFTMIELVVAMAIMATIIAIAMPKYFNGLERTKETALKQNLNEMRLAIDHYHADKGQYPVSLQALVNEHYLRFIPEDPITEKNDTWQIIETADKSRRVYDVVSGATTFARDGTSYNSW